MSIKMTPSQFKNLNRPRSKRVPGQTRKGEMNKLEAAYAQHLDMLKRAGEVLWYSYESVGLRLANKTHYYPDFMVMMADGELEIHETKGFMRDDANVKIKVAAEMYPFTFKVIRQRKKTDGGGFDVEVIHGA